LSKTVKCPCGAAAPLPDPETGGVVICPRCRQEVRVDSASSPAERDPAATTASELFVAGPAQTRLSCPICLSSFHASELVHRCTGCDQIHHEECWTEIGGCGTFGCQRAPAAVVANDSPRAPLTAWGDTKDCPICGETIKSIALKCRYCGAMFETVDPQTAADLRRMAASSSELQSVKQSVTALFIVSLLGCAAPLVALIAAVYLIPRRKALEKCGPLYKIMGWTALALSAFFSALMLLLILVQTE